MSILANTDWNSIWAASSLSKMNTPAGRQMKRLIKAAQDLDKERQLEIAWAREHNRINELMNMENSK